MSISLGSLAMFAQTAGAPDLLWLAIVFFVVALCAYFLGAKGVAGMSAGIGKMLLIVFVILAVLVAVFGHRWGGV